MPRTHRGFAASSVTGFIVFGLFVPSGVVEDCNDYGESDYADDFIPDYGVHGLSPPLFFAKRNPLGARPMTARYSVRTDMILT